MKNIILCIICFFILFVIGCDPGAETRIDIANKSSYDLNVTMNIKAYSGQRDNYVFDIKKNESTSLSLHYAGGRHDPNINVINISFVDLNVNEIISVLVINQNNIFEYIRHENRGSTHGIEHYLLNITDDLLFME